MRTVPTIDTRPTALLMIECFDDRAAYEISRRAIEMIGLPRISGPASKRESGRFEGTLI